jgi:hypothetical protein
MENWGSLAEAPQLVTAVAPADAVLDPLLEEATRLEDQLARQIDAEPHAADGVVIPFPSQNGSPPPPASLHAMAHDAATPNDLLQPVAGETAIATAIEPHVDAAPAVVLSSELADDHAMTGAFAGDAGVDAHESTQAEVFDGDTETSGTSARWVWFSNRVSCASTAAAAPGGSGAL